MRDLLTLFSPICPFFSHHLSTTLYGTSAVDVRNFPEVPVDALATTDEGQRMRGLTARILDFNADTWRAKNEAGLGRGKPIGGITIPDELAEFAADLTAMHKLE